jgi:hypothetical protein
MSLYVLKKFVYYHDDIDGYRIDEYHFDYINVYDDKSLAYQAWAAQEREVLGDISETVYELYDDEKIASVLAFVQEKTGHSFEDFNDFHYYFETNPEFLNVIMALSDDDLLELLQKMQGNRYQIEEISEEEANRAYYTIDIYDSDEDEYAPYCEDSLYVDNPSELRFDDKEMLLNADKFNDSNNPIKNAVGFDGYVFYFDRLNDQDKNNAALKQIVEQHSAVFNVDWDAGTLQFRHDDYGHDYSQDEIDALFQVNDLLHQPMFYITEHRLADMLNKDKA